MTSEFTKGKQDFKGSQLVPAVLLPKVLTTFSITKYRSLNSSM